MAEYVCVTDGWFRKLTDERIVRCRDCEHYHASIHGCDEFGDEWRNEYANVEPDGFCAWACRKEVDA